MENLKGSNGAADPITDPSSNGKSADNEEKPKSAQTEKFDEIYTKYLPKSQFSSELLLKVVPTTTADLNLVKHCGVDSIYLRDALITLKAETKFLQEEVRKAVIHDAMSRGEYYPTIVITTPPSAQAPKDGWFNQSIHRIVNNLGPIVAQAMLDTLSTGERHNHQDAFRITLERTMEYFKQFLQEAGKTATGKLLEKPTATTTGKLLEKPTATTTGGSLKLKMKQPTTTAAEEEEKSHRNAHGEGRGAATLPQERPNYFQINALRKILIEGALGKWRWHIELLVRQTLGIFEGSQFCAGLEPLTLPPEETLNPPNGKSEYLTRMICIESASYVRRQVKLVIDAENHRVIPARDVVDEIVDTVVDQVRGHCFRWLSVDDKTNGKPTNMEDLPATDLASRTTLSVKFDAEAPESSVTRKINPRLTTADLVSIEEAAQISRDDTFAVLKRCRPILHKQNPYLPNPGMLVPVSWSRERWWPKGGDDYTDMQFAVFVEREAITTHYWVGTHCGGADNLQMRCTGFVKLGLPMAQGSSLVIFSRQDTISPREYPKLKYHINSECTASELGDGKIHLYLSVATIEDEQGHGKKTEVQSVMYFIGFRDKETFFFSRIVPDP
ncbi:hypothetical protein MKZ38_003031 [Zalerion maritima]|uniref:Uncharacterized protein n=1 Tax=Zalerion maritima TaxID=339359 RepID=A0AAD5RN36_9PEZI|nr:hypothetical protein MKZ38_003031 [Zalerion maritima]